MLRRLFTILSALSLLVCVAAMAMWVRSYWVEDKIVLFDPPSRSRFAMIGRGRFVFGSTIGPRVYRDLADAWDLAGGTFAHRARPVGWAKDWVKDYVPLDRSIDYRVAGFGVVGGRSRDYEERALHVPAWFVAGLFAALPAIRLQRRIRRRLRYDLRATPECGMAPTAAVKA